MFGNSDYKGDKFRPKSQFPPTIQDPMIQAFEKVVLCDIGKLESEHKRISFNLKSEDCRILEELAEDENLTFKEADKGGALLILDKKKTTFRKSFNKFLITITVLFTIHYYYCFG